MPTGISFSNLFVDITNKRQQKTAQQLSQITGAIDQIAAHKKQTRLAAEREELLKDNREYQEQKALKTRQEGIYGKGADILADYTDKDVTGLTGTDPLTGKNLAWTDETLAGLELDIADRRETKEATDKISTYEQKLGEKVQYDKELGYYVEREGKKYDADVLIGKNKLTAAGTSKMTSTEKNQREWFSDRGKNYPANNIEAKQEIDRVQDIEERLTEFEGSTAASMKEGTEVIDGGIYRKLTPEDYKIKTTWFGSPTTKKGVKRNKKIIVEKDGEHFLPVTASSISQKLGLASKAASKVHSDILQNVADEKFMEEFSKPDTPVKEGEDRIQVTFGGGKAQTYTKEQAWEDYKKKYLKDGMDEKQLETYFDRWWLQQTKGAE